MIAQVAQLLANLETQSPTMDPVEPVAQPVLTVITVIPTKAPRPKRA